ncbi:hypothetical protein [Butyrivibrio sp. INlla21]|uniref:hypothetical protein n=1 Tax=Butyrivibrio sp. INlla21 TaxID=1520811 RepID=UPI0008E15222|nr:hypothetical protein [Butyrivibrio sp. INlla21]SFV00523.1 hypothetical protein SAMN02910342_02890 [Butyrivibrio sp. INlla21]
MGKEIKHDPITGEPMLATEDLSQAQLDPVLELKLTQEEYAKRQQNMIPPAGYGGQMGPMPQAGQAIRPGMVPPMVPKAMRANGIWTPEKAQYVAQKKIKDNMSKSALWLCIISLGLWLTFRVIFAALLADDSILDSFLYFLSDNLNPLQSAVVILLMIFALVFVPYILLIITRVKYKYNKFGKVLQWVYIGEIAIFVVLVRFVALFL